MTKAKPKHRPRTTTSTRWTADELSTLETAAGLEGLRRSDVVRKGALALARKILKAHGEG